MKAARFVVQIVRAPHHPHVDERLGLALLERDPGGEQRHAATKSPTTRPESQPHEGPSVTPSRSVEQPHRDQQRPRRSRPGRSALGRLGDEA